MRLLWGVLCVLLSGCGAAAALPTLAPTAAPPSETPRALITSRPTTTARALMTVTPLITATPFPTPTIQPTVTVPPPTADQRTPPPTPAPANRRVIGSSTSGREIVAYTFGRGAQALLLVGGVHGRAEGNTVRLMEQFIDHYTAFPADVPPGFSLVIVPVMNPDGMDAALTPNGRFNANGVDLNRNWGCGWQPEAVYSGGPVDPGSRPFSEVESEVIAAYIGRLAPVAALFYHSAADGVFPGDCPLRRGPWRSGELATVYGDAAGYRSGEPFSAYPVTGTAPNWADGQGIPSVDVELTTAAATEFDRNLRAVNATFCWLGGACD